VASGYATDTDTTDLTADHAQKVCWFELYEDATQDARDWAHKCRDYYDGKQWTAEELAVLEARNQPPTVINRVFKKINYLIGQEIQARSDPKALPRTQSHEQDAEAITDALRYVVDSEDFDKTASDAWEEKLLEGASAAIVEIETEPQTDPLGQPLLDPKTGEQQVEYVIKIRHVDYDRFFYDPHSKEHDFADAKYLGVTTWMDLDEAQEFWAARRDAVENAADILSASMQQYGEHEAHGDKPGTLWSDRERKRVRWTETYYKKAGAWHVCFASKAGFLVPPKPTGYRDEKGNDVCPLIADSAYIDRQCQRYGLAKHMLDVQDEINNRRSKALHWMSVDRMMVEEDALANYDEAMTERAKPDGVVVTRQDALVEGRVRFEDGASKAMQMQQMLNQSNSEIDMVGPDAPQIGNTPGGASGRALMMRQQIGNLEIARPTDNHIRWKRKVCRHVWYRVRQFWRHEKWMRVRDDAEKHGFRFVALNRRMTRVERMQELLGLEVPIEGAMSAAGIRASLLQEATQAAVQQAQAMGQQPDPQQLQPLALGLMMQHPVMQEEITAADAASIDVDILLEESPDTAILQIEEYEAFMQTLPTLLNVDPQNAKKYLAIGLELSGSRYKRKVLQMLQQEEKPDPQQQQFAQMTQQLQLAAAQANIEMLKAKAMRDQAAAQKTAAEAQALPAAAQLDMAQAAKAGAEAQVRLPAQAQRDMAEAQKTTAEAQALGMTAPAEAHRDHALAQKHEAETTTHVVVAVPQGPMGPQGPLGQGGM